ncbi:MAG: bifunctional 2-C-methyl-D-erythritol 4-phosphate cytidylyltransferase/2-C-methyl-D-erythritol 2,4-cyclodiphosphate synthase [Paracoccaceae bacterium]|nr:bifunctional 2-C-methyl-D-erythritol 4-phosphate cytidylyltransferase/2-C-methyl-D-erythritol 2,4-cyclodiphosphate synthase [Paracoccaceae bacterium]
MSAPPPTTTAALLVAAGRGTRAGGGIPKQWRRLGGLTVAERSVRAFADHPGIDRLVLVLHPDDIGNDLWPGGPQADIVVGGATRSDSVRAGLDALEGAVDRVLIHDIARPLVPPAVIDAVLAALDTHPGAAPGLPVTDALWTGDDGAVTGVQPRANLYRAQTPQGFHLDAILAAHRAHGASAADDVEIARAAGLSVAIVPGDEANLKITRAEDFDRAETLLGDKMPDIRTGNGYDVHRFGPGAHVTLCGIDIPHGRGLQGHSDADVAMHALTDAIYGALAEGDIGRHFPPSDPRWQGAASAIFLEHAAERAMSRGYALANADVTIVCEYPKIGPHAADMAANIARLSGAEPDRISVKATTSERLGFTGRGEGIAAIATVTLIAR